MSPDHAQNNVEYALLIACLALAVLLAAYFWGAQVGAWFNGLAARVTASLT
jgi:Flp pilus assembly pilin Flp